MSVNVQVPANEQEALRLRLKRLPRPVLWALAARLKTLGLSVTPVIAGTAIAAHSSHWNPLLAFTAAISAASIQIGTNLWNDAADAERGIDTQERLGPPRMTALGLLEAKDVRTGALIAFALAALCGLVLALSVGWPIIAIGLVSLALGYLYSMGPYPLSGTPLGEVLVIAFFGMVAVSGTAWSQGAPVTSAILLMGLLTGLPAAAVLLLNNHRDRVTDAHGGRRTLAILIGVQGSRVLYSALILLALFGFAAMQSGGTGALAALFSAGLLSVILVRSMMSTPISTALNGLIAKTALYQILLVLPLLA